MAPPLPPPLSAGPSAARPVTQSTLYPAQRPPTYLWQSIACMLCCCLPLGIPALVFACKVDPAFQAGRLEEAKEASRKAKLFCILAFSIGFVVQAIYLAIVIFAEMGGG